MVYCIERAYRTPDYCLWDLDIVDHSRARIVELSASSIGVSVLDTHKAGCRFTGYQLCHASGMAKAALDAINGMNVFGLGVHGSGGFIYVDPDALNRNRCVRARIAVLLQRALT